MKKIIILSSLLLFTFTINSQEIVSSSGDYFENSVISLSWTIGEPVVETFSTDNSVLTQGFQQSNLTVSEIYELPEFDIYITIAPNPVSNKLNVFIDTEEELHYKIYDFNGRVLQQNKINSLETAISFSAYTSAGYFLKIYKEEQLVKTFQIIKL